MKSFEQLKNLKTGRVPYLGLEQTIHVIKRQINLVRQVPLKGRLQLNVVR
jgi:hypothetical protein